MDSVYTFRGISGEAVRLFVRPRTLVSAVPTLIVMALLGGASIYLAEKIMHLPEPFAMLIAQLAICPILGGYALAARDGDLTGGVTVMLARLSEVASFAGRYVTLSVAWGLPVAALSYLLVGRGASLPFEGTGGVGAAMALAEMSGGSGGAMALAGIGLLLLTIVAVLMPVFTLIVSVATDELSEAFAKERWTWLLCERRGDLAPYLASVVGGMTLFFLVAAPILAVIVALVFVVDWRWGSYTAIVAYLLPWATLPILMGRLAGAFVAADGGQVTNASGEQPPHLPGEKVEEEFEVQRLVDDLREQEQRDPGGALAEAERLREKHPKSAPLLGLLCELYLRAGQPENALTTGRSAIVEGLQVGLIDTALAAFAALGDHRRRLQLEAKDLEQLGRLSTAVSKYDDAVWCFMMGFKSGGQRIQAERGIIGVAEAAVRTGETKKAMAVYGFFVKNFPDSDFVEYCKQEYAKLKRNVSGG